jgi:hypothetical protein
MSNYDLLESKFNKDIIGVIDSFLGGFYAPNIIIDSNKAYDMLYDYYLERNTYFNDVIYENQLYGINHFYNWKINHLPLSNDIVKLVLAFANTDYDYNSNDYSYGYDYEHLLDIVIELYVRILV